MILVDADILIDLFRGYRPAVDWSASLGAQRIYTSGFAFLQLLEGCQNKLAMHRTRRFLEQYEVIWPSHDDYLRTLTGFGERRLQYGLDVADALIAETAIGIAAALYTFNIKHFAAFPNLNIIQPYSKS